VVAAFDPNTRTMYIGARPKSSNTPDNYPQVTYSRAADLLGQSVTLITPLWSVLSLNNSLGPASLPSMAPLAASTLTSDFGLRPHPLLGGWREHFGLDLAARSGTPIVATSDGTVSRANWQGGYGLSVALDHGGGVQTRYGHMSGLKVNQGQHVRRGDVIGYVGSTGLSTGPHLHYEIRINGRAVDPSPMLRAASVSRRDALLIPRFTSRKGRKTG